MCIRDRELAAYEQVLDENRETIRSNEINKTQWKRLNREIEPGFTYNNLKVLLNEIMSSEVSVFKINLGFGVVSYNTIQQLFKYHYVSNNSYLFEKSVTIASRSDMEIFFEKIKNLNISEK